MGTQDRMGLPRHIDYVSSFALPPSPDARLHAVVTPREAGTFDAEVVDAQGNRFAHLKGYRTVATANAVNGEQVKTLRTMLAAAPVAA
jgi:hypothetical protein